MNHKTTNENRRLTKTIEATLSDFYSLQAFNLFWIMLKDKGEQLSAFYKGIIISFLIVITLLYLIDKHLTVYARYALY